MTRRGDIASRRRVASAAGALGLAWVASASLIAAAPARAAEPLATLDYRVVGVELRPVRSNLAIPKNIPGAVRVELIAGGQGDFSLETLSEGAIVEATLRGPSFSARRVVGLPNGDLDLPPLPLVGDYSLDDLRLVDAASGATRLDGSPRSIPITVFDDVLVSRVTSRPLTIDEIEERGIVIDESSFRVLEFEVGFVIDGETVPVRFPVVAPRFDGNVELIPRAELEELLAQADAINAGLGGAELPAGLEAAGLDIQIRGVNFQFVDPGESDDLELSVPPIPGLVVVPGRIGLLNQFFSVLLFTENAAPAGSGLSVHDLVATMTLPPGLDQALGTHAAPGDDPLRFARIGQDAVIEPLQHVRGLGTDGELGTADDVDRLLPGVTGQAEFLVEGLREGLHVMDITIDGVLDGLGTRERRVRGFASGSVLVRNPRFSLAFTHPRTIRTGEPYTASVTILNTSLTPANLVSVTLPEASLSGAIFEPGTPEVAELGTILPGETRTAEFRLRAQRTGAITFSQLTSDSDIVGRFRLRMGVDERGVELSPDALGYPDFAEDVRELAPVLFQSIERYLGQALSVATAAQLPPGVERVSRGALEARVVEIADAGQRLRYGDAPDRVLADLLLDFQGARRQNGGLDQIWRETDAGRELREAFLAAIATGATEPNAVDLLAARAGDWAGRGEPWLVFAVDEEAWSPSVELIGALATLDESEIGSAAGFPGTPSDAVDGHWLASRPIAGTLRLVAGADTGPAELALLDLPGNGTGELLRWSLPSVSAGACLRALVGGASAPSLDVDETCDGSVETTLVPAVESITEAAPSVLAVVQDEHVLVGRPFKRCLRSDIENYGAVVAVLFSKPMTQESVDVPGAYQLDDGNVARSVQIQPGGRVALLNLAQPIGTLVPRTLSVAPEVSDPRGIPLVASSIPVQATAALGVSVSGLVIRGNGEPGVGVPVTLTMYDEVAGFTCDPFIVRPAQARTDAEGRFHFDFVPAGIPYSVSATDTSALSSEAEALILEASDDEQLDRERLLELANGAARDTLLESFLAGALPEAIAAAEGLDRALLRDSVDEGSPRVGTNVPVTLRFRGRGTVVGTVFTSDGVTPAPNTAVNLFPDPDSRELGRGVFSDDAGRFAFFGVPLGTFTLDAAGAGGRTRIVSGVLFEPGESVDVPVVLSSESVARGAVEGRVLEADGLGHAGARILVGQFTDNGFQDVVAVATAGADGSYRAEGIPVGGWDLVALSFDGRRRGQRVDIGVAASSIALANVTLQGRTTVRGRVEFANGAPGGFALVAGGEAIVRADADGNFELSGVPTGPRSIEAAVEEDAARGIDFTRLGSAGLDVIAGFENFVVVRLAPAGRILGIVRDAAGNAVPNVDVSIPAGGGFLWVHGDAQGRFEFPNLALDEYTVSAPAPPHEDTDVSGILDTLAGSPSSADLEAAITQAFEIFTGVNNPLLNGEGLTFNPSSWGYEQTELSFDGQTAFVDVRFLPEGTIAGTVLNGQGVPIGARVRLTGVGPTRDGGVGFIIRGERNSDPALGTFTFPGQALAGDFGVQVASPFFPSVISVSGQTSRIDPDRTGLVLQFPSENLVNGRLAGRVLAPDGSFVANAKVEISFGDLTIHTDATGRFDTQIALPARDDRGNAVGYSVEAEDENTGLRGQSFVTLQPGITNLVDVHLLAKDGALRVRVLDGVGQPVAGAAIQVRQGSFPQDEFQGATDASGELVLGNLFEGSYGVDASAVLGATTQRGATAVSVASGGEALALVRLGATATLRGSFVGVDLVTPIAFAQLRIPGIGFATSDADGAFEMTGVPLGTHQLIGQDALTGRLGTLFVSLTTPGEVRTVLLVESALGLVEGAVIDGFGTATVPGIPVTLSIQDGFSPSRTVTTDPAGRFSFPGVPAGPFTLAAENPATLARASASATLLAGVERAEVDVVFAPLTSTSFVVLESNGLTPADATVTLRGPADFLQNVDTDAAGRVAFEAIPIGSYGVVARSRSAGETRKLVEQQLVIDVRPVHPELTLTLPGLGRVDGHLLASNGTTPIANRAVELFMLDAPEPPVATQTAADGSFAFDGVALGDFRLVGRDGALAATDSGTLASESDVVSLDLVLGPSGSVTGRLVSQDGTLPIANAEIGIAYQAPSGALGRDSFDTGSDGLFHFEVIPVGGFEIESIVPIRNGIARLAGAVAVDGETVDLGDVRLDEEDPRVVESVPVEGDQAVAIDTEIRLTMNEPLDANRIDPRAIFVRPLDGQPVAADVELVADAVAGDLRVLEIRPDAPLASETDYEVIVVDGELVNALGSVIAEGPRDLVGRILAAPFSLRFRTRDQDPPGLLSISPPDGAIQADPRAVLRLSFDEALATTGIGVTLTGPSGFVPGRIDVGVGAQVVVFTPTAALAPNATYTASIAGIRDVAGNFAEGLPFSTSFATLDTLGPVITTLALSGAPVGGATRDVVATLAVPESGVAIRLSADVITVGQSPPGVLFVPFALPLSGSTILRAIAIDRFGNEGPIAELPVAVLANQPPTVAFARLAPPSGPAPSGSSLSVRVSGADDVSLASLKAAAAGVASVALVTTGGAAITLNVPVPAEAGPGTSVLVLGEAIDGNGQSSGEQAIEIAVSDATPPSVAIAAPAPGAVVTPGEPLAIELTGADNFGITRFEIEAEGAVSATQSQAAAGTPGAASASFTLDVPAELVSGEAFVLRARAFDASGQSAETQIALATPDARAPRLLELLPPDGASVALSPVIAARFDEPIARASAQAPLFRLRDAANAIVPTTIGFEDEDRIVTLTPVTSLASGETFRVVLGGGFRDLAGNFAADADGNLLISVQHEFTVGGIELVEPQDGARVIEGQSIPASVVVDLGLGASAVRFLVNDEPVATVASNPPAPPATTETFTTTLVAPTLVENGGSALRIGAAVELSSDPGGPGLPTNEAALELLAAAGDEDGDGIPNGEELVFGTDPFADDRTIDTDGDGLMNTDEFARGTDPNDADSDNDGLDDGGEVAAGLDPLDSDSDDDGLPDGEDVLGGPRVTALEPNDGAVNVSVRPRLRVRFDEPVLRASVTPARFTLLENGATPVAAELAFSENDRVVDVVPNAALAFSTSYTLRITNGVTGTDGEPIRNTDGSDVGAPIERSFTTGVFGLTEPAGGAAVRERSTLALAASGNAVLGIASVRFEVNGALVATDASAPFEASFAVPSASSTPALSITAIAFDAGSVELARETISVTVVVGLDVASRLFGVPLGATRDLVLRLPVARDEALEVTLVSLDPAVASVPATPHTVPAGATELRIPVTGVAEGSTTLVATSIEDEVVVAVSVSALAAGSTLDAIAAPTGIVIVPFPSAGDVIVPEASTRTVTLRILAAPAAVDTELVIASSDPAIASIAGPVVIPAGSTDATFEITTGVAGTAIVTLVSGDDGRELRVISGAPSPANTPPVFAPPIGIVIVPFPSAGDVIVPVGSARTVTLRILATPAAVDTELGIASSDPAIASIAGPVVIPAGSTDATFEITTGVAGTAIVTLVSGDDGRELRVISGAPSAANTPPVFAPPIGIVIVPFPSAGDVIVPEASTRTVTLRILAAPAAVDTELVIASSDPSIASIAGPVVIPAGSTDATFEIATGVAGTAIVTLVAGDDGRELRVISGAPSAANTPPVFAPPIGIVIVPFPSAGDVIVPESSARMVTLRILATLAAVDTELVIVSSDPSVATIAGPVVIPAGSTDATFEIATGAAGTAIVTLVAGDDGRELRVISGAPSPANTPPVFAPPIGLTVMEAGNAGTLFIDPGDTRTFDLTLLSFPSLGDLPVSAVSLDPSVATVSPGVQVIPTGESAVTLTVTATAAGDAETRIDLNVGVDRRTLLVVVGVPTAERTPPTVAPPVSHCIRIPGFDPCPEFD